MVAGKNAVIYFRALAFIRISMLMSFVASVSVAEENSSKVVAGKRQSVFLEEVMVTAQKRQESSHDVGIAMSNFSEEMLEALDLRDPTDLVALVPGFTVLESGYSTPLYTLRGVGFNDSSPAATSAVGVYFDEVNLPFPTMTRGGTVDLQRIEVLKGPQGTLYGRNTTGGAINYIANKPSEEFQAGLDFTYSSYETVDLKAFVSGAISEDIAGRIAIRNIKSTEGWQYDYTGTNSEGNGKQDKTFARAIVEAQLTDEMILSVRFDGFIDKSQPQSPQFYAVREFSPLPGSEASDEFQNHPTAPDDDASASAWNRREEHDMQLDQSFRALSLRFDWDFGESTTFTALLGGQQYEGDDQYNNDGVTAQVFDYDDAPEIEAYSLELRLSGTAFDENVDWVAGYFHSGDTIDDPRRAYVGEGSTAFGVIFEAIDLLAMQDAESDAIFGQLEWQATDSVRFTGGLRYSTSLQEYAACTADAEGYSSTAAVFEVLQLLYGVGGEGLLSLATGDEAHQIGMVVSGLLPISSITFPLAPLFRQAANSGLLDVAAVVTGSGGTGSCSTIDLETNRSALIERELEEDNVSGKVAVDWEPTDDIHTYLSYTVGYKSGSFPSYLSSTSEQFVPVTQERVNAAELGLKGRFFEGGLSMNAAVFHYEYFDKQLFTWFTDPIWNSIQRVDNVPETKLVGAELELSGSPLSGLFMSISAAYLDSEVVEYTGEDSFGEESNMKGNKLDNTPELEIVAIVNYDITILNDYTMTLGVDGKMSDEMEGDLSNNENFRRDGYYVLNARVGFRPFDGDWRLQIFSRNVMDEVYYTAFSATPDALVRYTGMPRTYGITYGIDF